MLVALRQEREQIEDAIVVGRGMRRGRPPNWMAATKNAKRRGRPPGSKNKPNPKAA
jgi:hypothetical protein